jgi:hypothetical protein
MRATSHRAHEQQLVATAIQVAQDCAREVRLLVDKRRERNAARVVRSGARWTSTMQKNDMFGSRPPGRADWSNAYAAVSRLAAIRDQTLQDNGQDHQDASPANARQTESNSTTISAEQIDAINPDQLARAVAEIEKASSALRRSEPALETWSPDAVTSGVTRKYWSIWFLIGGIWISATLVVASATGAILYLLG